MTISTPDIERLQSIKTLRSLVDYLKSDLDWPIETDEIEDVFFEYDPEELGLAPDQAAGIKEIKQLRPMDTKQPWGIFWVNFEKKRLPVVMLRRILGHLVIKTRASANKAAQRAWHANDLLFISAYGEDYDRAIIFAHFAQDAESAGDLPVLKVLGWDGGDTVLHLADAHRTLSEKLRWPTNPANLAAWHDQWAGVFTLRHREVISTTTELVDELAKLATSIRKRTDAIISRESDRGPLRGLYGAFKTALIRDLTEDDFADVIAQTISYGLLAARFSSKSSISIKSLVEMIPPTNPFLRELLAELLTVAGRKKGAFDFDELGIQDVVDLLNHANAEAVKSDFGNRTRNEDPVIHFYEHFLRAYDRKKKVQRGVFFTPQPVVSYIVRSVHELLQTEFGLEDGLADTTTWGEMTKRNKDMKIPDGANPGDPFVLIFDPATGTATFLVEVIEVIFTHLKKKWIDLGKKPTEICRLWNEYVPKNLLPRLYGYELMMAPYTIAHMKLALKLQEINTRLGQPDFQFMYTDRAHIYLTNSLEPGGGGNQDLWKGKFPALAHEAMAVDKVKKDKRFTVVIGNPPYSVSSHNKGKFIEALMATYKSNLQRERNIQPLSDDYVKFICCAQYLLDTSKHGVLGFITNHSYLNGLIHRTMRRALLTTFDEIIVTDLHGNSFINEHPPSSIRDTNVFEIQQGVSLFLGSRTRGGTATTIEFSELWGTGEEKMRMLSDSKRRIPSRTITPDPDYAFFVPKDFSERDTYSEWTSLDDIFCINQNGVQTGHDGFSVTFDRKTGIRHVEDFFNRDISDVEVSDRYGLGDNSGWSFAQKRKRLLGSSVNLKRLVPYFYRPFDIRYIYYDPNLLKRSSPAIMPHLVDGKNFALFAMRKIVPTFSYSFFGVVNSVVDHGHFYMGNQGSSSCFPLYIQPTQLGLAIVSGHEHNLQTGFCKQLSKSLGVGITTDGLPDGLTAKDIFHQIYAIFHSPTYRTRYAEFLKIDFPRLPLTSSLNLFRTLAKLGGELVALHLMESPKLDKHITKWIGGKHPEVEKVTYSDETVWINKAKSEGFRGVPEPVWNFHIGGYQVCEKWLKDRKGRTLSTDDITHYHRIVVALSETIRLMAEIDQVIESHGGWPGAFQEKKA